MKTFRSLKYSAGLITFAILTTLTACGEKGTSTPPPQIYSQCVNCQNFTGSTTFFKADSQDYYGDLKLKWIFNGQTMSQPGLYGAGSYNYGSPITTYNGPIAAQGSIEILRSGSLGYCQVPAGIYNFGTVVPGQWSGSFISNLRLQAVGPVTIMMSMTRGQVSAKSPAQGQLWTEVAPVGRIFGNLTIESINGYPCSTSILVQ